MNDEILIREMVAAIAAGADECDELGQPVPPPAAVVTPSTALEALYQRIPGRLPHLFERLLLTYRWPKAELGPFLLLANPPGPGLDGFAQQPLHDKGLAETLLPARYVQFGRGPYGKLRPGLLRPPAQDSPRLPDRTDRPRGDPLQRPHPACCRARALLPCPRIAARDGKTEAPGFIVTRQAPPAASGPSADAQGCARGFPRRGRTRSTSAVLRLVGDA